MSRLILLHGFTQTGVSWGRLADELAASCPDLPGHGTRSDVRADLWESAELLAESEGAGIYVGYSMGGRVALHVALARPDVVQGLVLISATAGIDDDVERATRRASDDALAAHAEAIGIDAFLHEWLAQPMFAGLPASARTGRSTDVHGLASSLRMAGAGTQEPLWDRLPTIDVPVLVIAGALDNKYVALAERLAATLPRAELAVVPGAGHTVHLEAPEAFLDVLRPWLATHAG
jgi:2-succinyl-6-hydroxy-2,4-cyclohexadiene-1-carboxylate synthase